MDGVTLGTLKQVFSQPVCGNGKCSNILEDNLATRTWSLNFLQINTNEMKGVKKSSRMGALALSLLWC